MIENLKIGCTISKDQLSQILNEGGVGRGLRQITF